MFEKRKLTASKIGIQFDYAFCCMGHKGVSYSANILTPLDALVSDIVITFNAW